MVKVNRFTLSHDSVTCRRSPEVSSTAFDAQPSDLPPVSLMDMGFAISCSLARHRRPPIRFLFIGSHLCSALLSGPVSRRVLFHPCASLSLHVHHVVKRAFTSKLSNMFGTRQKGPRHRRDPLTVLAFLLLREEEHSAPSCQQSSTTEPLSCSRSYSHNSRTYSNSHYGS